MGTILSPWISRWTFKNYDYTLTFSVLSLVVAMTIITGGEIAILKGLKQLKKVAIISVFAALATLLICVPFYYWWGINGVVSALLASNAAVLGIHLYYTAKVVPWRRSIVTFTSVKQGIPMAKLGIAYVLAGIIGQGADFFISTFILNHSDLENVGLYNTGFLLITYVGSLLFTSMETDFFPRLSALTHDLKRANKTINQQIEVSVLLATPCLILEIIAMPFIIRLLYTSQFTQAGPMATFAVFYLFFKAMTLPVAYLALAKGDSKTFLVAELLYAVFIAIAVPFAFVRYGLVGAGVALSLASLFDLLMIHIYYSARFGFRFDWRPAKTYVLQCLLLCVCVYASTLSELPAKWGLSLSALLFSTTLSLYQLRHKTNFASRLLRRKKQID